MKKIPRIVRSIEALGWNRRAALWIAVSAILLLIEFFSGPFIRLSVLYIIPICAAAWFNGRGLGVSLAVIDSMLLFSFHYFWSAPGDSVDALINFTIRAIEFSVFAVVVNLLEIKTRETKILRGLLPICMYCKKIRSDQDNWEQLERYVSNRSEATFSHGICPECAHEQFPDFKKRREESGR